MKIDIVKRICLDEFHTLPTNITRNLMGIGSYVYTISYPNGNFVLKISPNKEITNGSVYWLNQLNNFNLPIPKIVSINSKENFSYCIMTFLEGQDLGLVYRSLTYEQKKRIAQEIHTYQNVVKQMKHADGFGYLHSYDDDENKKENWKKVVDSHIQRSENRIQKNGFFSQRYVDTVRNFLPYFESYFDKVNNHLQSRWLELAPKRGLLLVRDLLRAARLLPDILRIV